MIANPHQFNADKAKEEMLKAYPTKVARKRAQQIVVNQVDAAGNVPEIKVNSRTVPGIITQRGCTYAGCKGVVLGPTRDIVIITHGPIGCGYYSWLTRRNQTNPGPNGDNFMVYCFSTDMQEENIIFGGEKKLRQAVQEAWDLFHPKAISIFATCPVGLIGDDIHTIAREMTEKLGCNVFACSCEGYKGVSQSAGHHIANNAVFKNIVGRDDHPVAGKFKINLLGEYNIGGDAFELERILEACGITLVTTFSGNTTYAAFTQSHHADLNCVTCHRSINYMADMMQTKYGIPWQKVNFVGAESTAKSLRKIAHYFKDPELAAQVEKVIAAEMPAVQQVREQIRSRCQGKTAMLFVGGSRAHHYQDLFTEIGMRTVAAGYEFAHRDDYEGRKVLPSITVDADSRNIEELKVEADPQRYRARRTEAELQELRANPDLEFNDYLGMMKQMDPQALVVDDISHHETEKLIEMYHPDIFCAGIKEKFVVQKAGVPSKQLHSYDYGGPYAGFRGAANFYRDIDRMINAKIWKHLQAPWQTSPELTATFAH